MNAARNRLLTAMPISHIGIRSKTSQAMTEAPQFLTAMPAKSRYPCAHRLARLPFEDPRRSGKHWEQCWHREASRRPEVGIGSLTLAKCLNSLSKLLLSTDRRTHRAHAGYRAGAGVPERAKNARL